MYRAEPSNDIDCGWQFFSRTKTQDYINVSSNSAIYDVNTLANYDPAVIPYLNHPVGTDLVRVEGANKFIDLEKAYILRSLMMKGNYPLIKLPAQFP